jgi:hypothetical protein
MWLSSDTELIFIPRNNFGIINLTHPHFFRRQQATYARGGLQKYTELHGTTFAQSFLGHDEFKISEILKSHDWSRIPKFPCKAARSRSETERPRAGELEMAQTTAKNGDVFFSRSLLPTPLRNLFWTFQIFSIFPLVNPPFLGIRESTVFFWGVNRSIPEMWQAPMIPGHHRTAPGRGEPEGGTWPGHRLDC